MNWKTTTRDMQRRDFLKLIGAGLASIGALTASAPNLANWFQPPQIAYGASLLRGTQDGQIYQSLDHGQTWQPLISFGSHCAVCSLVTQHEQLYARLVVSGHAFWLSSSDAKTWRTLG